MELPPCACPVPWPQGCVVGGGWGSLSGLRPGTWDSVRCTAGPQENALWLSPLWGQLPGHLTLQDSSPARPRDSPSPMDDLVWGESTRTPSLFWSQALTRSVEGSLYCAWLSPPAHTGTLLVRASRPNRWVWPLFPLHCNGYQKGLHAGAELFQEGSSGHCSDVTTDTMMCRGCDVIVHHVISQWTRCTPLGYPISPL